MALSFGTLSTLDTLASTQQSIAAYGEDRAWEAIDVLFQAFNAQTMEMMGSLVEVTTDRQRRYGTVAAKQMQELDQWARPDAQKVTAGATVGFPLRLYGDTLQWTRKFMQQSGSAQQLAAEIRAILTSDVQNLQRLIKTAIFTATNPGNFSDKLVDNVTLAVKSLVNADSAAIPPGPNGETFTAASHTHYLYTASTSLAAADLTGLVETVQEHYTAGMPKVYINRAQETAVRGLTGFVAYLDARLIPGQASTTTVARGSLDQRNLYDRAIGVFGASEVVVKPWVPSGYLFAFVEGAPPPLVLRERDQNSGRLQLVADDEAHPLRAKSYEREIGVAVWQRTNGAALFVDAGSAGAYVTPTIT